MVNLFPWKNKKNIIKCCLLKLLLNMLSIKLILQIPEDELVFYVKLTTVRNDAELNEESRFAKVTVAPSDYIRGLIGYTEDSR